jgi:hypothetical protein
MIIATKLKVFFFKYNLKQDVSPSQILQIIYWDVILPVN